MPNSNGDFNRGLCACGNTLFRLTSKYGLGKLVKSVDNHTLVWQWYCNACGTVHQEPCKVVTHEPLNDD